MTKYAFRAALVALGLVAAAPAMAADANFGLTVNAGVVSDYTFRGISQTDEDPAFQAGIEGTLGLTDIFSVYGGIWGSSVDFNNGTTAEIDPYAGFRATIDKLGLDVGFIRYTYTGDSPASLNFTEYKALASYDFGYVLPSVGIYYSPDYTANSGTSVYYTAGVSIPIPVTEFSPAIKANIGKQYIDDNAAFGTPDYLDYNIGLFATYWGFTAGIQYVDTDLDKSECFGGSELCEGRAVFSLNYAYTF